MVCPQCRYYSLDSLAMSPPKVDLNLLQALLRAGRFGELEARAQVFLAQRTDHGKVWHLLGRARLALGRPQAAREPLERASLLLPQEAQVWADMAGCWHGLGEREQAATCFERSLALAPERADVWASAGRNALELGRHEMAEHNCRRALALRPGMAEAHFNLGKALAALGRFEAALAAYNRVMELAAENGEAYNAVALGLLELGRPEAALVACQRALALKPGLVEAEINLGNAHSQLGQYPAAVSAYRRALALNPQIAETHSNLGNALWELGSTDAALASYRKALLLKPDFTEALCNLGNALSDLEVFDEALVAYRRALELQPGSVELRYRQGCVLRRLRHFEEAAAVFQDILTLDPAATKAYHQLGLVFRDAGHREQAIVAFERGIELRPDDGEIYASLGDCLIRMGRLDEAVAVFRRALRVNDDDPAAYSNLLFSQNYLAAMPPEAMLTAARAYGEKLASQAEPTLEHGNLRDPERCLRVGLVSGDLGEHPVGHFLADALGNLATGSIELFAYETYKRKGALNAHLRHYIPHWRDAASDRLGDESLARLIRADGIDILVDLAGHTGHNRLPVFAWRPAPVQVAWLGYFATTGVSAIDWILADRWVLPEAEESHFVEQPWRLPDCYYCLTPPDMPIHVGSLPALRNRHITFGCFNNLAKVNDAVIACWAKVLRVVPESHLFLKAKVLDDASVAVDWQKRFASHGIGVERLRLEGASPRAEYLAAYHEVDIALDPFPFPGGTTSIEGLWMGVPVVTLKGDRFIGHQGATILHNAGLPEWIAADAADYVRKAALFAADLSALATLRAGLRERLLKSPLCDTPRFARNLEHALRGMWRVWCANKAGSKA